MNFVDGRAGHTRRHQMRLDDAARRVAENGRVSAELSLLQDIGVQLLQNLIVKGDILQIEANPVLQ